MQAREKIFFRTKKTYTVELAQPILQDKQYLSFDIDADGELIEVFVCKSSLQYQYKIQCFDIEGNLLTESVQLNDERKRNIGFIFEEPVQNVSSIKFVDKETEKPVTIHPEIILIYQDS